MQRSVLALALTLTLTAAAVPALLDAGPPEAPESNWPEPGPTNAAPPAGPQGIVQAKLADFAWLEGSWEGEMFGQAAEEIWSSPRAGGMMGAFRLLGKEASKNIYEFLLLEEDSAGIHLRFTHLGPGYKVWEKDGPLEFRLIQATDRVFTFESPDAAQSPNRLVYALPDPAKLIVTVETLREGDVKESFDVVYTRGE